MQVSSAPDKPTAAPGKRKSGVVVPHKPRWYQHLAAGLIYSLIRFVAATLRYQLKDQSGLFTRPSTDKFIFAIWHNRLALSLIMYRRYVLRPAPNRRLAAMVSAPTATCATVNPTIIGMGCGASAVASRLM